MSKIPAISLRSQWLGEKLRAARLESGYLMREAAEYLQTDQTTLGRFERGTHRIRRAYVKELLDFYGIADQREREYLLQLSEETWRKDWSNMDIDDLDSSFIDYTWLETKADRIRAFEPLLIYGLLQTAGYAQAATQAGFGCTTTNADIERAVRVRQSRQKILNADPATKLCLITEEAGLRRPIGGNQVLIEQLEHLVDMAERDNVDIRVLPPDSPWAPGHHGPFVHFEMPDPFPEIAYIENLAGRTFLEDATRVRRFRQAYDEMHRLALNARESVESIRRILKEIRQ